MISMDLALRLHHAGLDWHPADGDRFVLPDHDLDEKVFTISEMVIEVRTAPAGRIIAFNGTTEWALDAIEQAEAVWLPREAQLREALGGALLSLVRDDDGWRCTTRIDADLREHHGDDAVGAYARALLDVLEARRPV